MSAHGNQGEFCNLTIWHRIKWEVLIKPPHLFWRGNICTKIPPVLRWRHTKKLLFLFLWTSQRMWSNRSRGNFWGVWALDVRTRRLYMGWLLKFGEDSKIISSSVETFVDCLANKSPTWATYHAFISGCLIALYRQPGLRLVGVGETWRRLFPTCVLRVTGPEATIACQYDQICV